MRAVVAEEDDVDDAAAALGDGDALALYLGVDSAGPRPAALAPDGAAWSEPTAVLLGLPVESLDEDQLREAIAVALAAAGASASASTGAGETAGEGAHRVRTRAQILHCVVFARCG